MKPTLFLLAAGMGSRYGGLKHHLIGIVEKSVSTDFFYAVNSL